MSHDNMATTFPEEHFTSLQLLLKAPSKDVVREVCVQSFRPEAPECRRLAGQISADLSITLTEAKQLVASLHTLCGHTLFYSLSPEQLLGLFPPSFHQNLKTLLTRILMEQSPTWMSEAVNQHVSLPQLTEVGWRVEIISSSDSVSHLALPTCLLQLQMQDRRPGEELSSSVTVELSRETLDTMLDGLGRIRTQLASVAGK